MPKMDQLYSVATWDSETQAYTPQKGLSVPSSNITQAQLRQAARELRSMGYSAHRRRDADGSYDDSDWAVMIERTDGAPEEQIRSGWRR
jgi:hypothetical protein